MKRPSRVGLVAAWLLSATFSIVAVPAQDVQPRIEDRSMGEEEQILRRMEWFFSTRRAGTGSDIEMAAMRAAGVEETRLAIESQRVRRVLGAVDEANFWVPKGPSPSHFGGWAFGDIAGRTPSLAADWAGGVLYAGTASGGLWKSTNDGLTWTSIFDAAGTMTIGTVEVDPNDPNVLWAGTGENVTSCEGYFGIGLLRSPDQGLTWEARNGSGGATLEDLSNFASIVIDPRDSNHLVTGGRIRGCTSGSQQSGALYTSVDAGQTWTKRIVDTAIFEIVQDPAVQDVFWAATDKGVYKSTDNAVTWTLQTASGLPNGSTGRTELALAPSDTNTVYVLFASGTSGSEFWRTTDGGASWTLMSSGDSACDGQCWYNMVLRVHNTDPGTVYRGTIHVFRSTDGGVNWTDLSNNWGSSQKVHQDTHEFLMDPNDPDTFYVGCDGGVWKTTDGGDSFVNRNGNLSTIQFYAIGVDASDPETICGGAQDNSSLARATSDVWDLQQVTGDGFVCHVDPLDPDYAYITSYPGSYPAVYRSTGGVFGSFSVVTGGGSGITPGDRINWVTPYLLDPHSPNVLYLGTHRVWKSFDHGTSWALAGPEDMTGGSGSLFALGINRNFPSYLFAGSTSGKVWRTEDGGESWTEITSGLPSRSINDLAGDPTDPERAFAVVGGFNTSHLWEWTATGGWIERGGGLPNVPANSVLMITASDLLVGTDTGVFRSTDGGETFEPYMNGLPQGLVVTDLKFNPSQSIITAGTYGRGAWQVTIDPVEPIVIFDSIEQPLVEVDGDGDPNVEPGETWQVRPILRNAGGQTALGVTARLSPATPGVTVIGSDTREFGDLDAGATAPSATAYEFSVDPSFACGQEIFFDVVDVTSTNPPGTYGDRYGAFSVLVVDSYGDPITTAHLDEDFDPEPTEGWTHEAVHSGIYQCWSVDYNDEWGFVSKDAEHGISAHCGNGPGDSYSNTDYSWLYPVGKESSGGTGIEIPGDLIDATLTLVHWYDIKDREDGAQVVIDAAADGQDVFSPLEPEGGYPGGKLNTGYCNGLEDKLAFQGSSGGWITSTFDLTPYAGRTIWLAFVFGSDRLYSPQEGWYLDHVRVETRVNGAPICQVVPWPGSVPATSRFDRLAGGDIQATWAASCNEGSPAGQSYSIQGGDLDALLAGGTYTHAPLGGDCSVASPATFTPGPGNEYYLVVPNFGGRDGGAGRDSSGARRPQADGTCGLQREAACP